MDAKEQIQAQIGDTNEKVSEIAKSMTTLSDTISKFAENVNNGFKTLNEEKESEVIKSIQTDISNINSKIKASNEVDTFGNGNRDDKISKDIDLVKSFLEDSIRTLQPLARANSRTTKNLTLGYDKFSNLSREVTKSFLVSSDNTGAGFFTKPNLDLGFVQTIARPKVGILSSLVTNVVSAGTVSYEAMDYSSIDFSELREKQPSTETNIFNIQSKDIKPVARSAYVPVTEFTLRAQRAGLYSQDPIQLLLNKIDEQWLRSKDFHVLRQMVLDLQVARSGSSLFKNSSSFHVTNNANKVTPDDLLAAISKLDPYYTDSGNVALVIQSSAYDKLFREVGGDGHLLKEYFSFQNGLTYIDSSRGSIPVIPVSSKFFTNYEQFNDNGTGTGTIINSGYDITGSNNAGKLIGMVADLKSFTLVNDPIEDLDISNSFSERLKTGYVLAGKIGAFQGSLVISEAVVPIINKA